MLDRFVGRIDADAAGTSAPAKVFFGLVAAGVKIANPGQRVAEIVIVVRPNATTFV